MLMQVCDYRSEQSEGRCRPQLTELFSWPSLAAAGVLSVMLTGGCTAATDTAETPALPLVVAAYPLPRPQPVAFATGRPAEPRPATAPFRQVRYLGQAPWICTPSGFGHKSGCFRRP